MKHLAATFAATAAIQLGNLASGILAARLLLPEGRGQLAAIMLWPALIAAIGGLSINTSSAYFAAQQGERPSSIFAAVAWLSAALSIVLVAIGFAIIPYAYADPAPVVLCLAEAYLAFIPLNLFGLSFLALLQGGLRIGTFNVLRATLPAAYLAFVLLAFAFGRAGLGGFVTASLAANAVVVALALGALARLGWIGFRAPLALMRAMLRYALSSHLGTAVAILSQRLDQAMIALMLPAESLGLYAVAVASGSAAALVGGTIELVAFPKVAAVPAGEARAAVIARYTRATTGLAALAVVVLIPILPWLIALFFGRAFAGAVEPARILALAALPLGIKSTLYAALRGSGEPLAVARIEAVVLVALAAALAALLPRFGIAGAALALLVAQSIGGALAAARVGRATGLGWRAMLMPGADELRRLGDLMRRTTG